jgi:WXG100 family type VII secretion target
MNEGSGRFGYNTELSTMEAAAKHVEAVDQQIQAQLGRLRSQLEPLFAAWLGPAAGSFAGLKKRWDDDAHALSRALTDIGDALRASEQGYSASEEENQESFRAIAARFGGHSA